MIHPPSTVVLTLRGIENKDLENLPNMKSWLSSATIYSLGSGVNLEDSITREGFVSFSEFVGERNASVMNVDLNQEKSAMKQFDDSLPTLMEELNTGESLVLVVLENKDARDSSSSTSSFSSSERKLLSTDASAYKDRIALFYSDAQEYQLLLWTSIALIFITYFVVAALFNMDYGTDDAGLYSRFKTDTKNDESKNQ